MTTYTIDKDALTINLMRIVGIDKHKARECADIVLQMLAAPSTSPISQADAEALAHRIATTYTHRSAPGYSCYAFMPHTLMDFVRAIEAAHGIALPPPAK